MNETTLGALEHRIDMLEAQLRKWKTAVAFVGMALAFVAGMVSVLFVTKTRIEGGVVSGGEISATKFVVVNKSGDTIATLGSLGDGATPHLVFFDRKGDVRAHLRVDDQGIPMLVLSDEKEPRASFALRANGDPILEMWSKGRKGTGGTFITGGTSIQHDGLTLIDELGKVRAVLGSATLETKSNGVNETTAPDSLTLFDKSGRVVWQAPEQ